MAGETDQTLLDAGDIIPSDAKVTSGAKSDTALTSSSSNAVTQKITKKAILALQNYWKKLIVIEADLAAYHATSWLPGGVISSTSDLEFPTVDNTTIACLESHLIAGLDLPPSKFLVSIINFLRCELVHLNPNAIVALNYFPYCVNVGLGLLLMLVCSGIFMVWPNMKSKSSLGSGCHCTTTAGRNTWMPHSRAARKVPPKSGSSLILTLNPSG
jgi:hypothetical protein